MPEDNTSTITGSNESGQIFAVPAASRSQATSQTSGTSSISDSSDTSDLPLAPSTEKSSLSTGPEHDGPSSSPSKESGISDSHLNPRTDRSTSKAPSFTASSKPSSETKPSVDDHPPATMDDMESSSPSTDIYSEVTHHIGDAKNVLIALSSNPSVDEMATAIGLSIYLDKLGKRATAIYSGKTPNALEFLRPDKTFEPSADTLQDFVIALSKEKADHLRYKLDGSYVKIYITPYRSRIGEEDLDFSYGDYNVDLVLALDVANGIDLDAALREHGRIMHDAVIINITTGNPGQFGEIEWSDKKASSISEMIAGLLYTMESEARVGKEEATAFLTGIVAATNRFSNAKTTPETMKIASQLMDSGANQQLVSRNVTPDTDNEPLTTTNKQEPSLRSGNDKANMDRRDIVENKIKARDSEDEKKWADSSKEKEEEKEEGIPDDLKVVAESLSHTGAETTPETAEEPFKINSDEVESPAKAEKELSAPPLSQTKESTPAPSSVTSEAINPVTANVPNVPTRPDINGVPDINYMHMPDDSILPPPPTPPIELFDSSMPHIEPTLSPVVKPDSVSPVVSPTTSASPDIASVEEANPTLPPVEAPGQDASISSQPEPTPQSEAKPAQGSLGSQPAMQDQVYTPQASNPGAFKIPGL